MRILAITIWPLAGLILQVSMMARQERAGQAQTRKPTDSEELYDRVYKGDQTAIPSLEQVYSRGNPEGDLTGDILSIGHTFEANIASMLVSRGVKDPKYFQFIFELARQAIETDIPSPVAFGKDGHFVPHFTPPDFVAWCNLRKIEPRQAALDAWYHLPGRVIPLAASGDPRGFSLLAKGLKSPNYMVVKMSAEGLARINDARAIPLIIEACKKSPVEVTSDIATYLVYFDNAAAQAAVDRLITTDKEKELLTALRNDFRKRGLQAIFGY